MALAIGATTPSSVVNAVCCAAAVKDPERIVRLFESETGVERDAVSMQMSRLEKASSLVRGARPLSAGLSNMIWSGNAVLVATFAVPTPNCFKSWAFSRPGPAHSTPRQPAGWQPGHPS